MHRRIRHVLKTGVLCGLAAFAVTVATAERASAQTPEGTVIRNIATVTFTDAVASWAVLSLTVTV